MYLSHALSMLRLRVVPRSSGRNSVFPQLVLSMKPDPYPGLAIGMLASRRIEPRTYF